MTGFRAIGFAGSLAEKLAEGPGPGLSLYWLGQAGFVIDWDGRRCLIDPYLSDSLATKYRGTDFPHERMMPAPVAAAELGKIDLVFSTHHHTDHMDGETLQALAERLPDLRFVVPMASAGLAASRIGVSGSRLIGVDAGDQLEIGGIAFHTLRAAHEDLDRDENGHHRFLGYCLELGGARIVHSGDTIPFSGQVEDISALAPDLALLPVNGRSERLRKAGFAGNMTLSEALALCRHCGIEAMIAHHYGMFAFNTIAPEAIDDAVPSAPLALHRARCGIEYRLDDG